jgi:hypothetical protein
MTANRDHYQILGIDPKASEGEIRKAYKKLARAYHPDLNPKRPRSAHDRFRRLQEAYDVLSDPISRRQYDESLGIAQRNSETNQAEHTEVPSPSWTVDTDQEESGDRWFDRFNWNFISGLLLSILSTSWLVYLVNLPVWKLTQVRLQVQIALILFFVGIGLIVYDTFSSKPPQKKPPSSQTYAPHYSAPGEYVRPEYKNHERTVYFQGGKEKTGWLGSISWRRKLAIVVWAVCLLGAFLPGTIWVTFLGRLSAGEAPSFGARLIWPTIALIVIWIGNRMSNEDGLQTSIGAVGNTTIGYVLEIPGWLIFAYVMYGTLTGFVGFLSY